MALPLLAIVPMLKGAVKFLRSIPREVWLVLLFLAACAFAVAYHERAKGLAFKAGEKAAENRMAAQVQALKARQAKVTVKVETRYIDRVKVIREHGKTIVQKVPVYVPAGSCDLPGGFRVLHDAAVEGQLPDPAGIAHAATVHAQDAAATVIDNYSTCHETAERLKSLQEWVREQQEAAP